MLNPDRFTKQLCQQLEDDFGIPAIKHIVRPGLTGMREWLGEIAALDNGDALTIRDYSDNSGLCLHDGCLLIAVRAPRTPGSCAVTVTVEGFEPRRAEIKFN